MLDSALKARLPILSVQTTDLAHAPQILQTCANTIGWTKPIQPFSKLPASIESSTLYYGYQADIPTVEMYQKLRHTGSVLVLFNSTHSLVTPAGLLLPFPADVAALFKELKLLQEPSLMVSLRGMELRAMHETIALAQSTYGAVSANTVRRVRSSSYEALPGLYPVGTEMDFYDPAEELRKWAELNVPYFLHGKNSKLIPRGLLFSGPPGTGKTQGAKYLAGKMGVPLYRLDIAALLNRYVGASESQVARTLQMVDKEEPCVMLVDEVEKVFRGQDDGVTQRIMGQLLWWLQEHRTRVFTVMTTNNHAIIPPEFYRPGRVDRVICLPALSPVEAKKFIQGVFKSVLDKAPTTSQISVLVQAVEGVRRATHSHADLHSLAVDTIKAHKWA